MDVVNGAVRGGIYSLVPRISARTFEMSTLEPGRARRARGRARRFVASSTHSCRGWMCAPRPGWFRPRSTRQPPGAPSSATSRTNEDRGARLRHPMHCRLGSGGEPATSIRPRRPQLDLPEPRPDPLRGHRRGECRSAIRSVAPPAARFDLHARSPGTVDSPERELAPP